MDADELIGANVSDRIHPPSQGIVRGGMTCLTVEVDPVGQNDEIDVRLDGTIVMFRDITGRKKRERKLLAKVEDLSETGTR